MARSEKADVGSRLRDDMHAFKNAAGESPDCCIGAERARCVQGAMVPVTLEFQKTRGAVEVEVIGPIRTATTEPMTR